MSKPQTARHFHPQVAHKKPHFQLTRLSITALEADLAYFNARLELIGTPTTTNQKAQLATFRLLIQSTTRILYRIHHPLSEGI